MAFEFRLPDIGEGLTEAEVTQWLVEVGQEVAMDQPLVEIETDKAITEIPAPRAGFLLAHGAPAGSVVKVGEVLAVIGAAGEEAPSPNQAVEVIEEPVLPIVGTLEEAVVARTPMGAQVLPAVRKLARDLAVDLSSVTGTGPGGRITRQDVEASAAGSSRSVRDREERVRMSKLRRTIAANVTRSWREIPHVTTFGEADARPLLEARRTTAARPDGRPVPLEALLVRVVVPVLRNHPEFNASVEGDDVILKRHYDIGIAVDAPDGLMVPVIHGADRLDLRELADEVARLSAAARDRSAGAADLTGATFTISNIGAVGGGYGTPIIPWGTTAILSIGRAGDRPVGTGGPGVEVLPMFPLSLSYDHRVIDGSMGRRFLAAVIGAMERPHLDPPAESGAPGEPG